MGYVFAYTSLAIALVIGWLMPKHLTRREIYITWGWIAALTVYTDLAFGYIIDLYDFVEPSLDFRDLILQASLPPVIAMIILNFIPERKLYFIFYLTGVVLFSIFFEYLSV